METKIFKVKCKEGILDDNFLKNVILENMDGPVEVQELNCELGMVFERLIELFL